MSSYAYTAIDASGRETRGTLDVSAQADAIRRIRQMGLFPTRVIYTEDTPRPSPRVASTASPVRRKSFTRKTKTSVLSVFTRQLAILVEAGMPLLRGLRTLGEQQEDRRFRRIIASVADSIESGSSLAEAVSLHPAAFNRLYVNMVKAGEISGALDDSLRRLAEFLEKAQKLKRRIQTAMFYPCAVLVVAVGIIGLLMTFIVPRFRGVFEGLSEGRALPEFTMFVFNLSAQITGHFSAIALFVVSLAVAFILGMRTGAGRLAFDRLKLSVPVLGALFRKSSVSRFSRTLGTLLTNGVPILQALTIVRDTTGNLVVSRVVERLHESVKQGDPLAPGLKSSSIFPAVIAGLVDVGEQTGALPDMLLKIADNYDDEVENAAGALVSLLEPVMIVFLAVVVGGIVIAMFLPILRLIEGPAIGHDRNS